MGVREKLYKHFGLIYGGKYDQQLVERLLEKIEGFKQKVKVADKWDENDILLITYGDSITGNEGRSLITLKEFLSDFLKNEISIVHILPFFPYSSDDGFSVIDYYKVDPKLGVWQDVEELGKEYSLMFDLVINHISQQSQWFQNYLKGLSPGKDYFIEANPKTDVSSVVRPRSFPLFSRFETVSGEKYLWTTFSADQIDLDFKNPEVLAEMLEIFLFYIHKGARIIRLDAIAFLWKEIGTNCLHLPQTHEVVKLMRTIAEEVNPATIILTETNVPNNENLSYFGSGDEADMVYQFSLPPLLLYTLFSGNSQSLTDWAISLPELPPGCNFLNFTASHDGIGVRPLEGLLPDQKFNELINGLISFGALISTRQNSDGSNSPYEINITYFDALRGTINGIDNLQEDRFICSQTILMALKGIPAFYIHSLLATNNYFDGVKQTGMNRSINRRKWNSDEIRSKLENNSHHARILRQLKQIIKIRKSEQAFHPGVRQEIVDAGTDFFIIKRNGGNLISISNITMHKKKIDLAKLYTEAKTLPDIISGENYISNQKVPLSPYQTLWLRQ